MLRAGGQEDVICLYGDRGTRVCLAQYVLGEISLRPAGKEEDFSRQGEIFLLQKSSGEELSGKYRIVMESPGYRVCLSETSNFGPEEKMRESSSCKQMSKNSSRRKAEEQHGGMQRKTG